MKRIVLIGAALYVSSFVLHAWAVDDTTIQGLQNDVSAIKGGLPSEQAARIAADNVLLNKINSIQLTPGTQGPAGPIGPVGPQGIQGDIGPMGPQGPIAALVFTGQACPRGQSVVGFDASGGIICSAPVVPRCGDGIIDQGEQCDDGNNISGDGCSATCKLEVCGNGIIDQGEQCDDGNNISGDGCSANCNIEQVIGDPEPAGFTGITNAHNTYRAEVNSPLLSWDSTIATYAQGWANALEADNCAYHHNPDFGAYSQGENMATGANMTAAQVVNLWGAEKIYADPVTGYCSTFNLCGHYYNVVNPAFRKVGCGKNTCGTWVCNYSN